MAGFVKYGFSKALDLKKVVILIYLLQLIIALPLGMQVYQVIEASIGNSLSMNIIEDGFNRTVFEDFLNIHGASITPLLGTVRFIIPAYLLLSVFLHAGVIGNILKGQSSIKDFFQNALHYFISFLGINVAMFIISLVWIIVVWIPYLFFIGNPTEDHSSEKVFVFSVILFAIVFLIGIVFIWIWSLNVKYQKVVEGKNIWHSLKSGWYLSKRTGKHQLVLFLIFMTIHLATILLYFLVTDPIGASSMLLILFVMLLQQLFALFRIGLRVSLYGSLLKSAEVSGKY